jgi:hypothetical protein
MSQCPMPALFVNALQLLMLFLMPLCAGAVWSVLAQMLRSDLTGFVFVMPLGAWLLRDEPRFAGRSLRAAVHALSIALGILYAQALIAAVAVAGQFGLGLTETLRAMGPAMTLDLVLVRNDAGERLVYLAAMALAATFAFRRRSAP